MRVWLVARPGRHCMAGEELCGRYHGASTDTPFAKDTDGFRNGPPHVHIFRNNIEFLRLGAGLLLTMGKRKDIGEPWTLTCHTSGASPISGTLSAPKESKHELVISANHHTSNKKPHRSPIPRTDSELYCLADSQFKIPQSITCSIRSLSSRGGSQDIASARQPCANDQRPPRSPAPRSSTSQGRPPAPNRSLPPGTSRLGVAHSLVWAAGFSLFMRSAAQSSGHVDPHFDQRGRRGETARSVGGSHSVDTVEAQFGNLVQWEGECCSRR